MVGVEIMIRGLSEAYRTLALRVLSCFYLVVFAISAREGAYHQFPTSTTTTHYHHHAKRNNSIYFYDRDQFLRSG